MKKLRLGKSNVHLDAAITTILTHTVFIYNEMNGHRFPKIAKKAKENFHTGNYIAPLYYSSQRKLSQCDISVLAIALNTPY